MELDLTNMREDHDRMIKWACDVTTESAHHERMFFLFMKERQAIWERKNVLMCRGNLTVDSVLAFWRIPNVYRELDRTTVYLADRVLRHVRSPYHAVILASLFRTVNRIQTWEKIVDACTIDKYATDKMAAIVEQLKDGGENLYALFNEIGKSGDFFGNAYPMIVQAKMWREKRLDFLLTLPKKQIPAKELYDILQTSRMCGKLSAMQIVLDVQMACKTDGYSWYTPTTLTAENEWIMPSAPCEDACLLIKPDLPPLVTMRYLKEKAWVTLNSFPGRWYQPGMPNAPKGIRMVDIEHALVGYKKYNHVLSGAGRLKSLYATEQDDGYKPEFCAPSGWSVVTGVKRISDKELDEAEEAFLKSRES